jgi:hypothetical protein
MRMPTITLLASILGFVACSSSSSSSSGLSACCAFGEGDDAGLTSCLCGSDFSAVSPGDPNATVAFSRSTCTITNTESFPDSGATRTITERGSAATSAAQCAPPGASVSSDVQCCIFGDGAGESCTCSGDFTVSETSGVTETFDATACTMKTSAALTGDGRIATVEMQGRHATSAADCAGL